MKKYLIILLIICCLVIFGCKPNAEKNNWYYMNISESVTPNLYVYVNKPLFVANDFGDYTNFQINFKSLDEQIDIDIDHDIHILKIEVTKDNGEMEEQITTNYWTYEGCNNIIAVQLDIDEIAEYFNSLLKENKKLKVSLKYTLKGGDDNFKEFSTGTIYCSDYLSDLEEIKNKAPKITFEEFVELGVKNGFPREIFYKSEESF